MLTVLLTLLQYHYRPGSFSAWVADILEGHSKRRRSELLSPRHTLLSSQPHIASLSKSRPLHTWPVHSVLLLPCRSRLTEPALEQSAGAAATCLQRGRPCECTWTAAST